MRKTLVIFTLAGALAFAPSPAKASNFLDQLGTLLNTACGATYQFNFGGNWDWLCTLQGIYRDAQWILDNFETWAQDIAIQSTIGVIEGFMQSLGWTIGPGVNQFAQDIADAVKNVRRAPQLLRREIARAMLEDAKQKNTPLTGRYPSNSPPGVLAQQAQSNPTIAGAYMNEILRKVPEVGKRAAVAQGIAEQAEDLKDIPERVQSVVGLSTKILPPKEAEQRTNGLIKKGVADELVDKAKSAPSTREVMETMVEGLSYLLRLQATMDPLLADYLLRGLKNDLYNNASLAGLYDQLADQAEQKAGEGEAKLQAYAMSVYEDALTADQELGMHANLIQNIADFADGLPDGADIIQ